MEQREWLVKLVVRATEAEYEALTDRLGEAVCVPADHPEPCVTPWFLWGCAVDDLEEPQRSEVRGLLDE